MKTSVDKILAILNRYGTSISHLAKIIGKDRRTVASWLDGSVQKELNLEIKTKICHFFRYPMNIWECDDKDFYNILENVPLQEIRIIDDGYEGGLRYILEQEKASRFVIQPRFPGPAYRDLIVESPYKASTSQEAKKLRQERSRRMLDYRFISFEWYSIESLLRFAFCVIGNPYTQKQKILILQTVYEAFHDNYNKHLYLFDSHSTKVFGMDTIYMSIIKDKDLMFFKMPIDSVIVEISNAMLVDKMFRHFSSKHSTPKHIPPSDSPKIIQLLLESIQNKQELSEFYRQIQQQTPYENLFASNISQEYRLNS